ncbi:MAG: radical SAM protein [Lachnospiraceae bacterium]|nr:radical SAM protein [Lachnospiraceae bacterium]
MMRKKILIWGAGRRGENVYQILKTHKRYEIVAFGDNNKEIWGQEKFHLPIVGIESIINFHDLECIIIASVEANKIEEQLKQITDIPVYKSIDDLVIQRISIDISGFCNAKCKWCVTGQKNRQNGYFDIRYMSYAKFTDIYAHLYQNGIIAKDTEIMLFSWGEPLLNRDYLQIIDFLAEQKQKFSVSTNASKVQLVQRKDAYKNCCTFIFSMSGFSQASYDRIHGFSFERIKKNIIMLNENIKEHGFSGDGSVSFHVYQFNHDEISNAKKFSQDLGLRFNPYYPYFNGNSMTEEFLENRMDAEVLKEAMEELHITHVRELLKKRPEDYRCFLENIISIDCEGNLVLCCAADSKLVDYSWGSIFQVSSFEQMKTKRKEMLQSQSCQRCRRLGIDYWMGNNPVYQERDLG